MATKYALQHRTSRRYLAVDPSFGVHVETPQVEAAFTWDTMTEGEMARFEMGDFAAAWDIEPVSRPETGYPIMREGPR